MIIIIYHYCETLLSKSYTQMYNTTSYNCTIQHHTIIVLFYLSCLKLGPNQLNHSTYKVCWLDQNRVNNHVSTTDIQYIIDQLHIINYTIIDHLATGGYDKTLSYSSYTAATNSLVFHSLNMLKMLFSCSIVTIF